MFHSAQLCREACKSKTQSVYPADLKAMEQVCVGALEDTGRNVPGRGGQVTNPCSSSTVHKEVRALPSSSPDGQIWICLLQPPCSDKETDGCGSPAK